MPRTCTTSIPGKANTLLLSLAQTHSGAHPAPIQEVGLLGAVSAGVKRHGRGSTCISYIHSLTRPRDVLN